MGRHLWCGQFLYSNSIEFLNPSSTLCNPHRHHLPPCSRAWRICNHVGPCFDNHSTTKFHHCTRFYGYDSSNWNYLSLKSLFHSFCKFFLDRQICLSATLVFIRELSFSHDLKSDFSSLFRVWLLLQNLIRPRRFKFWDLGLFLTYAFCGLQLLVRIIFQVLTSFQLIPRYVSCNNLFLWWYRKCTYDDPKFRYFEHLACHSNFIVQRQIYLLEPLHLQFILSIWKEGWSFLLALGTSCCKEFCFALARRLSFQMLQASCLTSMFLLGTAFASYRCNRRFASGPPRSTSYYLRRLASCSHLR